MQTRNLSFATLSFTFILGMLLVVPSATSADTVAARLGGGNALFRSPGVTNANVASDILSRLTFASTHGGQPEDVPPGDDDEEQSGTGANGNTNTPANQNANGGNGSNGGATAGNGGNGADGGPSGLVRAGNVVSNSTAINAINTTIIRISR